MRADRFWMMEEQINRIKSEDDLRFVNVSSAANSADQAKKVVDALTLELGDKYEITRPKVVAPQDDAGDRLRALSGK